MAASLAISALASPAQALTVGDLQGARIDAVVTYDQQVRNRRGREWQQVGRSHYVFSIGDGGEIRGSFTRSGTTPRGEAVSKTVPMGGTIGKPQQVRSGQGHSLWMLEGDKLILLRTFETGGFKAEISFAGSGAGMTCSIRAPFAREVGAGAIRRDSIRGSPIEMLSATQSSSSCRVSR